MESDSSISSTQTGDKSNEITTKNGEKSPKVEAGVLGASGNLINGIVGSGILGIPYAFQHSGVVIGLLLLILVAYLTGKTSSGLDKLALHNKKDSDSHDNYAKNVFRRQVTSNAH